MIKLILKNSAMTLAFCLPGVLATFVTNLAHAQSTACRISLSQGCANHPLSEAVFLDAFRGSDTDVNLCLQRAADYKAWCGGPAKLTWVPLTLVAALRKSKSNGKN